MIDANLPESSGYYRVITKNNADFKAYYSKTSGHWIDKNTNKEIGFGLIITPPDFDKEDFIVAIHYPIGV